MKPKKNLIRNSIMKNKKQSRVRGDIVAVPLGDGRTAFALVLKSPLFAFFDLCETGVPSMQEIAAAPIAFKILVVEYAVAKGIWPVIGHVEIENIDESPQFFKRDPITKLLFTTYTGEEEESATLDECIGLECAAVWAPHHVVDRLNDHFAGRPNKWVQSLKAR